MFSYQLRELGPQSYSLQLLQGGQRAASFVFTQGEMDAPECTFVDLYCFNMGKMSVTDQQCHELGAAICQADSQGLLGKGYRSVVVIDGSLNGDYMHPSAPSHEQALASELTEFPYKEVVRASETRSLRRHSNASFQS